MDGKDMSGVEHLRELVEDASACSLWGILQPGSSGKWGAYLGGVSVKETLRSIADQIEREHAEALAAAKRGLTDEAQEAVKRLRGMDCVNPRMSLYGIVFGEDEPKGATSRELNAAIRDRLCDLIEHGGRQDVDVAALLGLADEMSAKKDGVLNENTSTSYRLGAVHGIGDAPERIRKAVEGAPKPDVDVAALLGLAAKLESVGEDKRKARTQQLCNVMGIADSYWEPESIEEAIHAIAERIRKAVEGAPSAYERLTAYVEQSAEDSAREAAADWVEAQGGLDVVKAVSDVLRECVERRDEVLAKLGIEADDEDSESNHDAIMAELDKRLMPPGMEWPRFEDGERIEFGSAVDGLGEPCEKFIFTRSMGYVCQLQDADGNMANVFCGNLLERPEPDVLGADKLPIRKGETVYRVDGTPCDFVVDRIDNKIFDDSARVWRVGGGWVLPSDLTHTPPETQERIEEDKQKWQFDYWKCGDVDCADCPSKIDGKTPRERYGVALCSVAQGLDLARRECELDAKTMGGDAK